jgi:hypothetical protein
MIVATRSYPSSNGVDSLDILDSPAYTLVGAPWSTPRFEIICQGRLNADILSALAATNHLNISLPLPLLLRLLRLRLATQPTTLDASC